jgi:shikimate kinase
VRIYLTGFMGSGKTTVGRALAERLGVAFADLDDLVEVRAGRSIRAIFEESGEGEFRRLEREALVELAARPDLEGAVVATGGGTMAFEPCARLLAASGLTVWLNPTFATIVERIGGLGKADRPLFREETQALALYRERLAAYRRCDLTVDVAAEESAREVAARIAQRITERR